MMEDTELVRVLKALGHPVRLRIVQSLAEAGELSCGEIGEHFSLSQPAISHHLKILFDAAILLVRRKAQHGFVSVNQPLIRRVSSLLPTRLAHFRSPSKRAARRRAASK